MQLINAITPLIHEKNTDKVTSRKTDELSAVMIILKSLCPVILHRDESGNNFVMRYANVEITSRFYFQIRKIRDAIRECGIHFTFFS